MRFNYVSEVKSPVYEEWWTMSVLRALDFGLASCKPLSVDLTYSINKQKIYPVENA